MSTATWKTRISSTLVVGLLGLAIVIANALPASAQDACPLPAGLTKPAPPRVTAEDVTDRGASLMDFALAVKERSVEHSQQATAVEEGLYIACAIRQDNGIWRSGDTYIVTLTLDGRVFIHAKDMSLAGRQLNPLIYGAILPALGITPDPATLPAALGNVYATGAFPNPDGGQFALPAADASGYATSYYSPELQSPIVLIAGFDLNESHLVPIEDEDIDYGEPATTAAEVVDRATLKAFVTAAGEYFIELMKTGDPTAAAKCPISPM